MAYIRKTRDVYPVQQLTAEGWEDVCEENTRREAQARVREYRANQPGIPVRRIKRRERIAPAAQGAAA